MREEKPRGANRVGQGAWVLGSDVEQGLGDLFGRLEAILRVFAQQAVNDGGQCGIDPWV